MTDTTALKVIARPDAVVITRRFAARRELVFQAWSSADHIKRWFSPASFTTPEAEVEFHAGGVFAVCMRWPDGTLFWSRGKFTEVSPPDRLQFAGSVIVEGAPKFATVTTVTFEQDGFGTLMTVTQAYEIYDQAFLASVAGAPEGWRTTLDKLEREVERIAIQEASVAHGMFTIERTYAASPAKVFRALTDLEAKSRWFSGGPDYTVVEREMDVRPGGRERLKGRWANGNTTDFSAVYWDVIADRRLVYTYEMKLNERKISVSLATLEISAQGDGARLRVTEQGAFLDGYDDAGSREHGTGFLLDRLGASLVE